MRLHDPGINTALILRILRRLNEVARATSDIESVRQSIDHELRLATAVTEPREVNIGHRQRGRSFFDELQLEILALVRSARSREDLLKVTIERLAAGDPSERSALCYVVFEGRFIQGNLEVEPILQAGIQRDRFQALKALTQRGATKSAMLNRLFVDRLTVDFSYTEYLRGTDYNGEFDSLIDDKRRGAWIVGIPLPGIDRTNPDRALIGIYPSAGSVELPNLPRGARPEWRLMEFLQTGYALLTHQLEGRAEMVAADRRNLIADLAPQAINHELATQLGALGNQLENILTAAKDLQSELADDHVEIENIVNALESSFHIIGRATRITNAFNNIERRVVKTAIRVRDLLDEVEAIVDSRRKRLAVALIVQGDGLDTMLHTDAALVEHLLLNITVNALDAIEEGKMQRTRAPRIVIEAQKLDDMLCINIGNTGPSINAERRDAIFEKGVTTKRHGVGHGHGLYICRLIANYLQGTVELSNQPISDMNVSFKVQIPINALTREDLLSHRDKSRR